MILKILKGIIELAKLIIKKSGGAPADVSGLTAVPGDVEKGKIFYGSGSEKTQSGTVENRGIVRQTIGANGSYTIQPGIYASGGYVKQNIATQGAVVITPTASGVSAGVSGKYMTGNITVKGVENLVPENIRQGAFIGTIAGTFQGYVNNDPLSPYWYGIFAPGQTGSEIMNRSPSPGDTSGTGVRWQAGTANPDGQYIYMYSNPTSGGSNPEYPAFRFNTPIEMEGVKSVSIMYNLPSHSANQYTWIVLAEKQVSNLTGGQTWTLSESRLGAYESHVLPATGSGSTWGTQTFILSNASRYKYIYVGIGVAPSNSQGRFIYVKYVKLNK